MNSDCSFNKSNSKGHQSLIPNSLENLFEDVHQVQGVFDLGERDSFIFGNGGEASILIAFSGDDEMVCKRGDSIDHPFIVASGCAACCSAAHVRGDDEDALCLAVLDDFFQSAYFGADSQA